MNKWLSTLRQPQHRRHNVTIKTCALLGCLRGRVLPDFRSRSCFFLNSYRSCDTCLIVKTLPVAECIVSHYTFLSQACSEQSKAHTSIAFVPRYFFAGTRNSRKWWPIFGGFRPGLGTFSGPEGGTCTVEKRLRSTKMKETSTVKLQRELQKYANRKKEVLPQRVFFALIGKDIQKDFKKIYEIRSKSLEFGWGVFFRCLFLEKFGIIGKEPFSSVQKKNLGLAPNMEWSSTNSFCFTTQ